jgi:hypothetical protein
MSQRTISPKSAHATILTPPGETESSSAAEQLDKGYPGQRCVKAPAPDETPPPGHFEHLCNASENLLLKTQTVPVGHSEPRRTFKTDAYSFSPRCSRPQQASERSRLGEAQASEPACGGRVALFLGLSCCTSHAGGVSRIAHAVASDDFPKTSGHSARLRSQTNHSDVVPQGLAYKPFAGTRWCGWCLSCDDLPVLTRCCHESSVPSEFRFVR